MNPPLFIRNARIIDPANRRNEVGNLFLRDGVFAPPPPAPPPNAEVIDAAGLVAAPGFIDVHVHLREPGGEEAETIETGSRAAARGGFTTIVSMPNTKPPIDTPERVAQVLNRARATGPIRVIPSACITADRAGHELADLAALAAAGAATFTDDGATVPGEALMRQAMQVAGRLGKTIMDHAQDRKAELYGVMHEGAVSRRLGVPGIPSSAEASIVERDIELAAQTGCALHIQHVSAKESVDLLRDAKRRGLRVSAELTPHHLALTDADIRTDDANYKMNPPLRGQADQAALIEGILDGTIQAFATDHAPHSQAAKARGFRAAPFGIVGLETAVGITYTKLVHAGLMNLDTWVWRWTVGPARALDLPAPSLSPGQPADLVLLDLASDWTVQAAAFVSRSRNMPYEAWRLRGRAVRTICRGATAWNA